MFDFHVVLGVLSVIIGAAAYVPYMRDVVCGTTRPHPFTWLVFSILNSVVFFGQSVEGAGAGSWNTAMTGVACLILAGAGALVGRAHIKPIDWLCLVGALCGVVLLVVANEPLMAVIVATITDALAFAPTARKAFFHPNTETASAYILGTAKYILGLFALETFNLTTALFPTSIIILNMLFLTMLFTRRRQLSSNT